MLSRYSTRLFVTFSGTIFSSLLISSLAFPSAVFAAPSPTKKQEVPAALSAPTTASFELNEQGVEAIRQKDFPKAEALFQKALTADPGNLTAAFNLSGMLITNKRQQDAISLLTKYIAANQNDAGLYVRRADAQFSLKNLNEATADYEQALKIEPSYSGLAAKLGTVYALAQRTKEAQRVLLIAVEQEPKNAQLLHNLSNIFLVNGDAEKAISTAKRALQIEPSSDLYVTLGNAYENKNDLKNSLIAFERALDLGDKRPELKEKITALKKVVS
jgi:tetratricopeptide (TPR) repeat protein